jgi:hypothetical protein
MVLEESSRNAVGAQLARGNGFEEGMVLEDVMRGSSNQEETDTRKEWCWKSYAACNRVRMGGGDGYAEGMVLEDARIDVRKRIRGRNGVGSPSRSIPRRGVTTRKRIRGRNGVGRVGRLAAATTTRKRVRGRNGVGRRDREQGLRETGKRKRIRGRNGVGSRGAATTRGGPGEKTDTRKEMVLEGAASRSEHPVNLRGNGYAKGMVFGR